MYGRGLDGGEILNPGLLRHQITWQVKALSGQDSFGVNIYTWTDLLKCRARVQATSGKEFAQVMQRFAEADYVLTQHFSKGLSEQMRIAWLVDGGTTYLDVLSIDDPAGTERYQMITCKTFGTTFTAET